MRTYLLLFFLSLTTSLVFSQVSFSDDFESYMVGDYVGAASADWSTWSGATGGAEDAQVTAETAASGSHSIYFEGAVGGGPQDVVLPFGGKYTEGSFQYEMNMYVPDGKNAYFNFQGEQVPGQTWTMNAQFRSNGNLEIDDGGAVRLSTVYPHDEWFNIGFDLNITSNLWQVSVNGECIGSFDNPNNFVASIDIFPIDENSAFYVDDVAYAYDLMAEEVSFDFDAGITSGVDGNFGFTGEDKAVAAMISNSGTEMITSFEVSVETAGGTSSQTFMETIAPGDGVTVQLDNAITLSNGDNPVKMSLSSINGMSVDDNLCNNSQRLVLTGFKPFENKKVFFEEATGTWCQWCPRGDVFMNLMTERYPERFVGIAVHNNDPMADVVPGWDAGLTSLPGFSGFPSAAANRSTIIDPSGLEGSFVSRVQDQPLVYLEHGALYDESTRELWVSVSTNFLLPLSGDIRLFVGLTEDGINRDEAGYAQSNAYAGGGSGVMGGYELLPSPVPASQMVYNHVGRHMFTEYGGLVGAYVGEDTSIGDVVNRQFGPYTVPDDFDVSKMHIVSAFVTATGVVDNANSTTIDGAVANGYVSTIDQTIDAGISVYPNPFSTQANIKMSFDTPAEVSMEVTDAMGKLVAQRNYGTITGTQVFTFNGATLAEGVYYMKLYDGERFTTKKVVVSH